jgi:aspartyl protease family protein
MRLFSPLAVLGAALAMLMLTPAETRIGGLDHPAFAAAATLLAALIYVLGGARASDLARAVSSVAIWVTLLTALVGVCAYRFEAVDFFERVTAELLPAEPQVGQGGAVIVNRRLGGEFAVAARANGARVTFIFDTGASMVVLTAADAQRARLNVRGLVFDVPVATANGAALAAQVRLDELAVGPIVIRNVRALVAKPGALQESLLGMSFLERLKSYAVDGGRLILSAK